MSVDRHKTISRRSDELRRLRTENEYLRRDNARLQMQLDEVRGNILAVPLDDPALLHKTLKDIFGD